VRQHHVAAGGRQQSGGHSIIAGDSDLRTSQEYTLVPVKRQEQLMHHMQGERREKVIARTALQ
jgi:hypothetical protein